jgi:hypothetical protein
MKIETWRRIISALTVVVRHGRLEYPLGGVSMKQKAFLTIVGTCLLVAAIFSPLANAEDKKPATAPMKLSVGDVAPDFKLQYFDGSNLKDVSLSQYRGKSNIVLAFYIFAFTGG